MAFFKGGGKPGGKAVGLQAAGVGGFGGGFTEEDRGQDWSCTMCRERNFAKRQVCFKCNEPRGVAQQAPRPPPAMGTTMNGMVKSYNKKGFGFIMCMDMNECQDIYYTRESVSSRLLHPDMPGEHVTFEIKREGRRLIAVNIRPLGEEKNAPQGRAAVGPAALSGGSGSHKPGGAGGKSAQFTPGEEDRSQDWMCPSCNERNFMRRNECFRCKNARPLGHGGGFADTGASSGRHDDRRGGGGHGGDRGQGGGKGGGHSAPSAPPRLPPPRRTFSPHAGARAIKESMLAGMKGAGRGRGGGSPSKSSASGSSKSRKKSKRKKRSRSKSSGSASSSSRSRSKKKKAKKKKGKKRDSSSSSEKSKSRSSSSGCEMEKPAAAGSSGNPEIDAAKSEALEQLLKLRSVEPMESRMSEWRALLRKWHPDKNPERSEVATAVFQFLQKGKPMLDAK